MLAQARIQEIVRGRLAPAYRRPRKSKRELHGLVNNAGIYQPWTLMESETKLFERRARVNQLGCFLGMKIVVPLMEQSEYAGRTQNGNGSASKNALIDHSSPLMASRQANLGRGFNDNRVW
jgi:NAD(P)-dependent dehydrogenase (short-subunit alcohol dehydrogenase family)